MRLLPESYKDFESSAIALAEWLDLLKVPRPQGGLFWEIDIGEFFELLARAMGYLNWPRLEQALQKDHRPVNVEYNARAEFPYASEELRQNFIADLSDLLGFKRISLERVELMRAVGCSGFGLRPGERVARYRTAKLAKCWEYAYSDYLWKQSILDQKMRYVSGEAAKRVKQDIAELELAFWGVA
jgi:hypothetical protein